MCALSLSFVVSSCKNMTGRDRFFNEIFNTDVKFSFQYIIFELNNLKKKRRKIYVSHKFICIEFILSFKNLAAVRFLREIKPKRKKKIITISRKIIL